MSGHSDNTFLQLAKDGDAAALTLLLTKTWNWLGPLIDAEIPADLQAMISADSILQETYLVAFRGISRFRGSTIEEFSAWLKTTAMNRLKDVLREQRRDKRGGRLGQARISSLGSVLLDREMITASEAMAVDDRNRIIEMALANLKEIWREALLLKYVDHLTVDEVAEKMGVSAGAVRGYLERGRQHLQDLLGSASELLVGRR